MSQTASTPMFECGQCGKAFKWKPEIAGKKAKCACGASVVVPSSRPGGEEPPPADLGLPPEEDFFGGLDMNVAPAPPPIPRRTVMVESAPKSKSGGKGGQPVLAGATGGKANTLAYQRAKNGREKEADENMSLWGAPQERKLPLILLAVSSVITFGGLLYQYQEPLVLTFYCGFVGVAVAIMIGGAFMTASIAGISFGVLGLAVIRLAAVCMVCEAIDTVADVADFPGSGLLGWAGQGIFSRSTR